MPIDNENYIYLSSDIVFSNPLLIYSPTTAASLNLPSGPAVVSILVSKNAGRYRIQGDSFPAMLLVLEELDRRLHARVTALAGGAR